MKIKIIQKNSEFVKRNLSKILLSVFTITLLFSLGIINSSRAVDNNEIATQKIEISNTK